MADTPDTDAPRSLRPPPPPHAAAHAPPAHAAAHAPYAHAPSTSSKKRTRHDSFSCSIDAAAAAAASAAERANRRQSPPPSPPSSSSSSKHQCRRAEHVAFTAASFSVNYSMAFKLNIASATGADGSAKPQDYADESAIHSDVALAFRVGAGDDAKSIVVTASTGETVLNLRRLLHDKHDVDFARSSLHYDGAKLVDPMSLNDYPKLVEAAKAAGAAGVVVDVKLD